MNVKHVCLPVRRDAEAGIVGALLALVHYHNLGLHLVGSHCDPNRIVAPPFEGQVAVASILILAS